jgi:hypothetical protein
MVQKDETGKDVTLIIAGEELAFTSISESDEVEMSESQDNESINPNKTVVSQTFNGSGEYDGSRKEFKNAVRKSDGTPKEDLRILVEDTEGKRRYEGVTITNIEKETPADERTNTSFDWEAEKLRRL